MKRLISILALCALLLAASLMSCGADYEPICEINKTVENGSASVTVEYAFGTETEAYVVFSVKAEGSDDDGCELYLPSVIVDAKADGYGYGCIDRRGGRETYILTIQAESGSLTGKSVSLKIGGIRRHDENLTLLCGEDFAFDFRLDFSDGGKAASVGKTDNHPSFSLLLNERALIITPDLAEEGNGNCAFSDITLVKQNGEVVTPDINSSSADSSLAFTVCIFDGGINVSEIEKAVIDGVEVSFE